MLSTFVSRPFPRRSSGTFDFQTSDEPETRVNPQEFLGDYEYEYDGLSIKKIEQRVQTKFLITTNGSLWKLLRSSATYECSPDFSWFNVTTYLFKGNKKFDDPELEKCKIEFNIKMKQLTLRVSLEGGERKNNIQNVIISPVDFTRIKINRICATRFELWVIFTGSSPGPEVPFHSLDVKEKFLLIPKSGYSSQLSYPWVSCVCDSNDKHITLLYRTHLYAFDQNSVRVKQVNKDVWMLRITLIHSKDAPSKYNVLRVYFDQINNRVFASLKSIESQSRLNMHNWCYWNIPIPQSDTGYSIITQPLKRELQGDEEESNTFSNNVESYHRQGTITFSPTSRK